MLSIRGEEMAVQCRIVCETDRIVHVVVVGSGRHRSLLHILEVYIPEHCCSLLYRDPGFEVAWQLLK